MSDHPPDPQLLRSLSRLVRGLSALFWGLPAALIVCVGTGLGGWLPAFNVAPVLATTALPLYGLWHVGAFQRQERPWRRALDRTRLIGLINFGLSPFLYWWYRMPANPFFAAVVGLLVVTGLLFIFNLNLVVARLGEMLPDETLRMETRQFTQFNRVMLIALIFLLGAYVFLAQMPTLPPSLLMVLAGLQQYGQSTLLLMVLLPLSLTMALIWKTKEVILESVFEHRL